MASGIHGPATVSDHQKISTGEKKLLGIQPKHQESTDKSVRPINMIRRRRTTLSVSCCPCLVFVRIYQKTADSLCRQTLESFRLSEFSWQICPVSVRYLYVRILPVSILSAPRILSGFEKKRLPLSVCPVGQGRNRVVRTFTVLVRRCLIIIQYQWWSSWTSCQWQGTTRLFSVFSFPLVTKSLICLKLFESVPAGKGMNLRSV